jgi:hypothetical protein
LREEFSQRGRDGAHHDSHGDFLGHLECVEGVAQVQQGPEGVCQRNALPRAQALRDQRFLDYIVRCLRNKWLNRTFPKVEMKVKTIPIIFAAFLFCSVILIFLFYKLCNIELIRIICR